LQPYSRKWNYFRYYNYTTKSGYSFVTTITDEQMTMLSFPDVTWTTHRSVKVAWLLCSWVRMTSLSE